MIAEPFFAFVDGALNYDCSTCNALCCRGGYGTAVRHGEEWQNLKHHYPLLSHFAVDQGKYIYLINYGPQCFFLKKTNLCQIEEEYGRKQKPLQCRLFPYQVIGHLDQRPIIQTALLCPYTLDLNFQGKVQAEHFYQDLATISAHEVFDIFDDELFCQLPPPSYFALENEIKRLCRQSLTNGNFKESLTKQLEATQNILKDDGVCQLGMQIPAPQLIETIIFYQSRFLGIHLPDFSFDKSDLGRSLITLSPIIRVSLLKKHPYLQIGYLSALYLYALISAQIHGPKLSIQTIANINLQVGAKLEYLALFPFAMIPKERESIIRGKMQKIINRMKTTENLSAPSLTTKTEALSGFLNDLLQGKILGAAACHHFQPFTEYTQNQFIELFIHYFSPSFLPTLDLDAFLKEKEKLLCSIK